MTNAVHKTDSWQSTACILCSRNCGIEIDVEDGRIEKVRGKEAA